MSKKKEEQLAQAQKTAEAARQAAAPQSGYSTADLNSRSDVQNALAGAEYRPSQNVTDAANDLKQWQQNRRAVPERLSGQDERADGCPAGAGQFPVQLRTGPALPPSTPSCTP